jgi:hypothetical protein
MDSKIKFRIVSVPRRIKTLYDLNSVGYEDLTGVIIRLEAPADATDAQIAEAHATIMKQGASAIKVIRKSHKDNVISRVQKTDITMSSTREVIMQMVDECLNVDKQALCEVIEKAISLEGI